MKLGKYEIDFGKYAGLITITLVEEHHRAKYLHLLVRPVFWTWRKHEDYYDGAPMTSYGFGPLFLYCTFGC